jgi:hypothetical protein
MWNGGVAASIVPPHVLPPGWAGRPIPSGIPSFGV